MNLLAFIDFGVKTAAFAALGEIPALLLPLETPLPTGWSGWNEGDSTLKPFRLLGGDRFCALLAGVMSWLYMQPERTVRTVLSVVEPLRLKCTFFLVLASPVDSDVSTESVFGVFCLWNTWYDKPESPASRHSECAACSDYGDVPRPRGRGEDMPRRPSTGGVPADAAAICGAIPPSSDDVVTLSSECEASGTKGRESTRLVQISLLHNRLDRNGRLSIGVGRQEVC